MLGMVVDTAHHTLVTTHLPDPVPASGEVTVRVRGAGLAHADLAIRAGTFIPARTPNAAPQIAGTEFAGEITAVGDGVGQWHVGDRVMGRGPGYAELVTVRADGLLAAPADFSWEEAGGAAVAVLTAHDALITQARLQADSTVLVQGATSSVGIAATRIALIRGARRVFVTGRSHARLDIVRGLTVRADAVVPWCLDDGDIETCLADHGARDGVDIVIDMVGGNVMSTNVQAAAVEGRIVQVGRLSGNESTFNLDEFARKRLTLTGVSFRTRSTAEVAAIVRRCATDLSPVMGDLRPPIHRVYPLTQAVAAQEKLARGGFVGKIVLTP